MRRFVDEIVGCLITNGYVFNVIRILLLSALFNYFDEFALRASLSTLLFCSDPSMPTTTFPPPRKLFMLALLVRILTHLENGIWAVVGAGCPYILFGTSVSVEY
jgi:hypothetical protein